MLFSESHYASLNRIANDQVIVLPLGATEQHGPHLSVSTDTDIVTAIATEAEKKLSGDILLCPSLPFGSSHHHLSYGGTISVSPETYTRLIVEITESLLQSGFKKIVLLNGHGGNITPVKQALSILSNKYDTSLSPNIVLATYWEMAGKTFTGSAPMESPALSHACEYETSLMLHLFPGKVFTDRIKRAGRPDKNGYIPFEDDEPYNGVVMFRQTAFISNNGSSGEPQLGTAEKGKYLFTHAVDALVKFIISFRQWPLLENLTLEHKYNCEYE